MRNFTTSILNAITDNLRNRYDDGFPILKELLQNADDARADHLVFGRHQGFTDSEQPLLRGPGLWFWNDGEIKEEDIDALCSFGINAKARDCDTIGKFGLGMKSVFHLCEAFFFMAWDGQRMVREGLTPWDPAIHPAWEQVNETDWKVLVEIGEREWGERSNRSRPDWFLLWIPLRQASHLETPHGRAGSIIERFPGDNPKHDLGFLTEPDLPLRLAEILPLLHHLVRIDFRGDKANHPAFSIQLQAQQRLERQARKGQAQGWVEVSSAMGSQRLSFSGQKHESGDDWFARLRSRPDWPKTYVRDALGREEPAPEKARPEAAVLFARATDADRLTLRWAVFLPLPKGEVQVTARGGNHFRITLHGQFFIDSGRKGIHEAERLHETPPSPHEPSLDDASLRWAWNARLFQEVLAPSFLPALDHFVMSDDLGDQECRVLTAAIAQTDLFTRDKMRQFVCKGFAWCRVLAPGQAGRWTLIDGDGIRKLRPLPSAPAEDVQSPWRTFPDLEPQDLIPFDRGAPWLMATVSQWTEAEVDRLMSSADLSLAKPQGMAYLADFLDDDYCAAPYRSTLAMQGRLVSLLRHALATAGGTQWRKQRDKSTHPDPVPDLAKRLIDFIKPENRLGLAAEISPPWLDGLLQIEAGCLLVPRGLEPSGRPGLAKPDDQALEAWLKYLDRALQSAEDNAAMSSLLAVVKGLLKSLNDQARVSFLGLHEDLRIVAVYDCQRQVEQAVSLREIKEVHKAGTLFDYAIRDREQIRIGMARLLVQVLPKARIWLIQTEGLKELIPPSAPLPRADSPQACLVAVSRYTGPLGDEVHRRALLEHAYDPGDDSEAIVGLRLLLHGRTDKRLDSSTPLWVPRQDQHSAWQKLWSQLHSQDEWALIPRDLAGCIPGNHWKDAGIQEIDSPALLSELQNTGRGIPQPADLEPEERDEILSRIDDRALWQRLPLHTTCCGEPVSIANVPAWLAPVEGCPQAGLLARARIIRRSNNVLQARNQFRPDWLRPLDEHALIEIGLSAQRPAAHWQVILDALARLPSTLLDHLPDDFRHTAWLPTRFGSTVAPEDVIDLQGNLQDTAERLVVQYRSHGDHGGQAFAVPGDIDEGVISHPGFGRLRQKGFASGNDGLAGLALLLEKLPAQAIGHWPREPASEVIEFMALCPELPGWQLLRQAGLAPFAPAEAWHELQVGLCNDLTPDRLVRVLEWISQTTTNWEARKDAYDTYLHQLVELPAIARQRLGPLRLATRNRTWRLATELCAGAVGVKRSRVLDDQQAIILRALIQRMDHDPAADAVTLGMAGTVGFAQSIQCAPEILKHFFEPWGGGLVSAPMIGVVLALLGPRLRGLARTYLHPHSFGWLLQDGRLPWRDPGQDGLRVNWMGQRTLDQALELIQAAFHEERDDHVEGLNLFGDALRLPLETDVNTLIAGALRWKGGYRVEIPLRRIDPARFSPDALADILRCTAEELFRQLYNQRRPDFRSLWQELDRTDQLEIGIARRLILQHIPFYLRQLSLRSQVLHDALNKCDAAGRHVAEQEEAGSPVGYEARQQEYKALVALGNQLRQTAAAQEEVLAAIRRKIGDSKYEPGSIPFELFQNGDDAAVELGLIQAFPGPYAGVVPDDARRFVVEVEDDTLRFLHWGRTINDRGPAGFDGDSQGFGRDLEKMLVLSASDKIGGVQVTGRLGLGFKSVLLACNRPRILSGRLAVEIVGGILPNYWESCDQARAVLSRNRGADSPLPGTLIELPEVSSQLQPAVLDRFRRLAGILCCFGRAIRFIEMRPGDRYTWQPDTHHGLPDRRVEYGQIRLHDKEWGETTGAMCLRTVSGSLLMGMGPRGFRALPEDVPAVWVTAPTREKTPTGFAINGPFELDPGRARLDGNSEENRLTARRIGSEAGDLLAGLLERTRSQWAGVQEALALELSLTPSDFWQGIWLGLSKICLKRSPDPAVNVARETILVLFKRLSESLSAIPNGLPSPAQGMISTRQIRYELATRLATPEVIRILNDWSRFTRQYPLESVVAEPIGAILKASLGNERLTVTPLALLSLIPDQRVEPEDARILGRLFAATPEQIDWEEKSLQAILQHYQFKTEANTWATADMLLTNGTLRGDEEAREECLRYDIAPAERRLLGDYLTGLDKGKDALALFLTCRRRMNTSREELGRWILGAADQTLRAAALRLLARTNRQSELCEIVRGKDWLKDVLNEQDLLDEAGLNEAECNVLWRLLPTNAQISELRQILLPFTPQDGGPWAMPFAEAMVRLHEWWAKEQAGHDYRSKLYPGSIDLQKGLQLGEYDRSAWLTLFALGAFQSLPWCQEGHNRNFLSYCQAKGWWKVFWEKNPVTNPDQWMDIIGQYAESQTDDQEWNQWIGQFPTLYRLARWLDMYRELFLSIKYYTNPFVLDDICTSKASYTFQGTDLEAPPVNRTLKNGAHLIIRELLHYGVLANEYAVPHAYAPIARIKSLFARFNILVTSSQDIHEILTDALGPDGAHFHRDYDIPLRIVAGDENLQRQLFSN